MASGDDLVDEQFCSTLDDMTKSVSGVREVVQGLLKSRDLEVNDGISLLSLKHHLLLSYIHSLTLMMAHRVLGHSLTLRTRPPQPFTDPTREVRGSEAGDLVDTLVEDRIILEKIKQLESKMRYQIEKLVRIAGEPTRTEADVIHDPLAFRPNPESMMDEPESASDNGSAEGTEKETGRSLYRPPKVAPVPYPEQRDKTKKRAPVPAGLAALAELHGATPQVESASGLGSRPSMMSSRARELARMNEFEEENMTRLVMTKKEARRRARDEEDVALGGSGLSRGRRGRGGLEDEFADILQAVDRGGNREGLDDGYDTLRMKGRKQDLLSRSRIRSRANDDDASDGDGRRVTKKGRFNDPVKATAPRRRRRP